jgi:hypothetical protein
MILNLILMIFSIFPPQYSQYGASDMVAVCKKLKQDSKYLIYQINIGILVIVLPNGIRVLY